MEQSQESQQKKKEKKFEKPKGPGIFERVRNFFGRYRRVLNVARKPDRDEYFSTLKITGSSLLLIGSIGFIIFLLYYLLRILVIV